MLRRSVVDARAFHDFYVAYVERVVSYFARRTFDADDSVDLTAETFAAAFFQRAQFRGTTVAEEQGWLFAIARNELSQFWRRGQVERDALSRLALDPPILGDEDYERIETLADLPSLRRSLEAALDRLPSDQSDAIRLKVLRERTYAEVAALVGVSEQVVRARVSRGLRSLHEQLDDTDVAQNVP